MPAETERINEADVAATAAKAASYKKKQIIVALLLVGLLIAILTQPRKQDIDSGQQVVEATQTLQQAEPATGNSSTIKASESPEMRADRLAQVRELSRIELDEITKLELLAPEPQRVRQKKQLKSVQPVKAIYGTSTNRTALVGQSIIRSGQPLPDGQKVLDVTTDGVQLEQ